MSDKASFEMREPSEHFAKGEFSVLATLSSYLFSSYLSGVTLPEKEVTISVDDLLNNEGQSYIRSFIEKFSSNYSEDDFAKLHKLLELKNYNLSQDQLKTVLIILEKERDYINFRENMLIGDPSDLQKCVRNFVKLYHSQLDKMKKYKLSCQKYGIRAVDWPVIKEPMLYTGEHSCISMKVVHKEVKDFSVKIYFLKRFIEGNQDFSEVKINNNENLIKQLMDELEVFELEKFEEHLSKKQKYSIEEVDSMDGYRFEKMLVWLFERMGYIVKHTKLANDQGADLILEKLGQVLVVQAKRCENKIGNNAVQEVAASIKHYKAQAGIVITNNEFTNSAMELAKSNSIDLINRQKLISMLKEYG